MARKGKRHSSRNVNVLPSNKTELARLLDSRKLKHKEIKEPLQGSPALVEQFESLLERFQPPKEQERGQVIVYHDVPEAEEEVQSEIEEEPDERPISRRKQRKATKIPLAELKNAVSFPQLIEWYDCDAQYPYLLASIKSSKNVVPVPDHWQNKREYLSGRSFLEKRPFELPDIIKETDIEQMRQVMPDANETKDPSLKETVRARVQPKMGSLDIDYKKLHDVFFKLGANWKPDYMLPFGDMFYEHRNLYEEAQWEKLVREKRPGKISSELRKIMNLSEGKLPPWCMKMNGLGMPPGYPNLKIAGLNWDIEHLKGDTYGTLSTEQRSNGKTEYFGQMIVIDEPEDEIKEQPQEPATKELENQQQTDVKSTTLESAIEVKPREEVKEITHESPRELYKVLEEKTSGSPIGQMGSRAMYAISTDDQEPKERTPSEESKENERRDHIQNFKF